MIQLDLTGKTAIVTGAARGVGRDIVHTFVDAGAAVVAADRDEAGLRETCAGLGERARAVPTDIRDEAACAALAQAALDAFGALDICVNNAAVAPHASLLEERAEVWDTVFAVNCRGTFLMTQAAARVMAPTGRGGRIINFSSGVTRRGSPGAAAYASSRAATETFSSVAAVELAQYGILVNTVRPGLIDTQPKPLPPAMAEALRTRVPRLPLARAGEPHEVAELVLFLASEAAGYLAGAIIDVDGGASLGQRWEGSIEDDDPRYFWVTGAG